MMVSCIYGDFETVDPYKRHDGNYTFGWERTVLSAFLEGAHGLIDVKSLSDAYYEDSGPEGSIMARKKMMGQIRSAYGSGALKALEELMGMNCIENSRQRHSILAAAITSSTLDSDGKVTALGKIDASQIPSYSDMVKQYSS